MQTQSVSFLQAFVSFFFYSRFLPFLWLLRRSHLFLPPLRRSHWTARPQSQKWRNKTKQSGGWAGGQAGAVQGANWASPGLGDLRWGQGRRPARQTERSVQRRWLASARLLLLLHAAASSQSLSSNSSDPAPRLGLIGRVGTPCRVL